MFDSATKNILTEGKNGPESTSDKARNLISEQASKKPDPAKDTPQSVPRLFGDGELFGLLTGWDGAGNVGFSFTSGNTRTLTLTSGIRGVKSGQNDKLTLYLRSLWNRSRTGTDNRTTSNAVWGGVRYDRNVNDRMFGFGAFDFERDSPNKLYFRSVLGGGLGDHILKNKQSEWDMLLGSAWNHTWQLGKNVDIPEAHAGSSFKHKFNERINIQKTFDFYQNMTNWRKSRFLFDSMCTVDITRKVGWFVSVGDRYNSTPIGSSERNDVLVTTGIKWNFGKKK
jgi:putative salt-induced outer membrane protein YdiY